MNEQEQRIAIAEACRWSCLHFESELNPDTKRMSYFAGCPPTRTPGPYHDMFKDEVPDYLHDLNACHEMEEKLTFDERNIYIYWLEETTRTGHRSGSLWEAIHATPAQRAEAFLLVKGLWKD